MDTIFTPEFKHPDCEQCRFLFRTGSGDAYWHPGAEEGPGVIVLRYSDKPNNYSSKGVKDALLIRNAEDCTSRTLREVAQYLLRSGVVSLTTTWRRGR